MNPRRFKTLSVAIRDVEHPSRALLTKAARLAEKFGARLELLHAIAVPYVAPRSDGNVDSTKKAEAARQLTRLERAANRIRKTGIDVTCTVIWDYPAAEAIVRHVLKTKPDVVLAESHHHSKLARWFIAHTDWELIRSCPCPLWLVKSARLPEPSRVMVAVDPFHGHAKPAALDQELLRIANVASGGKGRVGAAHVFAAPITMIAGGMGEPIWVPAPLREQKRVQQGVVRAMQDLTDRFGIAKADRIVEPGDAATELPRVVKRWGANLLVMGAVSRSGIKRAFIGNTAEQVIDATHCDVLIVKPRSFKTSVSRRTNEALMPISPI